MVNVTSIRIIICIWLTTSALHVATLVEGRLPMEADVIKKLSASGYWKLNCGSRFLISPIWMSEAVGRTEENFHLVLLDKGAHLAENVLLRPILRLRHEVARVLVPMNGEQQSSQVFLLDGFVDSWRKHNGKSERVACAARCSPNRSQSSSCCASSLTKVLPSSSSCVGTIKFMRTPPRTSWPKVTSLKFSSGKSPRMKAIWPMVHCGEGTKRRGEHWGG